jgi:5-aminolevulinate synthase
MNYDDFFADAVMRLQDEGRYRVFANLERIPARSGIRRVAPVT